MVKWMTLTDMGLNRWFAKNKILGPERGGVIVKMLITF